MHDLFRDVAAQYARLPDSHRERAYWLMSDATAESIYAQLVRDGVIDAMPDYAPGLAETMFNIPVIRTNVLREGRIRLVIEA